MSLQNIAFFAVLYFIMFAVSAWANPPLPTLDSVVHGDINFSNPDANTLKIDQASPKGIINWDNFSIGKNRTVEFQVPDASSVTLNRVTGNRASNIQGALKSNGHVWLVNPNGIVFQSSATVDVSGLLATTSNITDADFLADRFVFSRSLNVRGSVENKGRITAREGGLVSLVAPQVKNSGIIEARLGLVQLRGGTHFTYDFYGDGLIQMANNIAKKQIEVSSTGQILADGGSIYLSVKKGADILDNVINVRGVLQARSVENVGGVIVLHGDDSTHINARGTMDVSGQAYADAKGRVEITGVDIQSSGGVVNISGGHEFVVNRSGRARGRDFVVINTDLPEPVRPVPPTPDEDDEGENDSPTPDVEDEVENDTGSPVLIPAPRLLSLRERVVNADPRTLRSLAFKNEAERVAENQISRETEIKNDIQVASKPAEIKKNNTIDVNVCSGLEGESCQKF